MNERNFRRKILTKKDLFFAAIVFAWSFFVFATADAYFSYDFWNYIRYFDQISEYSIDDFLGNWQSRFPYIYVFVPPSGQFEFGFAGVFWLLMAIGIPGQLSYALVASISIVARILLLRLLGAGWFFSLIISVLTISLFEANALRLGMALTSCIVALFFLLLNRRIFSFLFLVLGAVFHVQILAFFVPAILIYMAYMSIKKTSFRRVAVLLLIVVGSVVFVINIPVFFGGKISDYADSVSGAVGINIISLSAFVAVMYWAGSFCLFYKHHSSVFGRNSLRIIDSAYLAAIPSLVALIFATDLGALGDRLWQFSFAMLLACSALINVRRRETYLYYGILGVCLVLFIFNITIRYPLANFFSPFIFYNPIYPLWVVD